MKLFLALLALCLCVSLVAEPLRRDDPNYFANQFAPAELINGAPAKPGDYPACVYASMSSSRCSATVVGERVLLIASHCVSNGGSASFSVGANQYKCRGAHGPGYPRNSTADWTLCLTDKKVVGAPYEHVLADASLLKVGTKVRLAGYGCTRSGGGGGNDGVFRTGLAEVIDLPTGTDYDTVTRGGAALCYGDSGGPAFLEVGAARYVFGVNSRGDISTTSYLSSTYVKAFLDFAVSWSNKNGQKICGVHADALGCRAVGPPPAPTDFEVDTDVAKVSGKVKPGHEAKLPAVKDSVQRALEALK